MKPNVFAGNVALNSLLFCIAQFQTNQTLVQTTSILILTFNQIQQPQLTLLSIYRTIISWIFDLVLAVSFVQHGKHNKFKNVHDLVIAEKSQENIKNMIRPPYYVQKITKRKKLSTSYMRKERIIILLNNSRKIDFFRLKFPDLRGRLRFNNKSSYCSIDCATNVLWEYETTRIVRVNANYVLGFRDKIRCLLNYA